MREPQDDIVSGSRTARQASSRPGKGTLARRERVTVVSLPPDVVARPGSPDAVVAEKHSPSLSRTAEVRVDPLCGGAVVDCPDMTAHTLTVHEGIERPRAIIEADDDGISVVDEWGMVGSFNPATEEMAPPLAPWVLASNTPWSVHGEPEMERHGAHPTPGG